MKGSLSLTMRMTTCIYAWWQESRMTVLGLPVNFLRKTSQIMNLEVFRVFSKDGIYGIYTVTARADALLTLLWSLSYPCQHYELSSVLYRWTSALSHSINDILEDILYCRLNQKLSNRHATSWMDLDEYCSTVISKGCSIDTCWGFTDGTCMCKCRPTVGQQPMYSGNKRQHSLKFRSVITPCGLIVHLFDPIEGYRHLL